MDLWKRTVKANDKAVRKRRSKSNVPAERRNSLSSVLASADDDGEEVKEPRRARVASSHSRAASSNSRAERPNSRVPPYTALEINRERLAEMRSLFVYAGPRNFRQREV